MKLQYSLRGLLLLVFAVAVVVAAMVAYKNKQAKDAFDFVEQGVDGQFDHQINPCRFTLSKVYANLKARFPIRLSKQTPDGTKEGLWIGCKRIERTDKDLTRWIDVCTLRWKNNEPVKICHYHELIPAFEHSDEVFLYWDRRQAAKSENGSFYLSCTPTEGWRDAGRFTFATVPAVSLEPSHVNLLSIDEFETILDGRNAHGERTIDGVGLSKVKVLRQMPGQSETFVSLGQ